MNTTPIPAEVATQVAEGNLLAAAPGFVYSNHLNGTAYTAAGDPIATAGLLARLPTGWWAAIAAKGAWRVPVAIGATALEASDGADTAIAADVDLAGYTLVKVYDDPRDPLEAIRSLVERTTTQAV